MKNLSVIISLALLGFILPSIAYSASNLGTVTSTANLGNTGASNYFRETFKFKTDDTCSIGISITTTSASGSGVLEDFEVFLDGFGELKPDVPTKGAFSIKLLRGTIL